MNKLHIIKRKQKQTLFKLNNHNDVAYSNAAIRFHKKNSQNVKQKFIKEFGFSSSPKYTQQLCHKITFSHRNMPLNG